MIIDFGSGLMQPRSIRYNDLRKEWNLWYGWPRGKSWSQGSTCCAIKILEFNPKPNIMTREELKTYAGECFKKTIGGEPDTLTFLYENEGAQEYEIKATFGERDFIVYISINADHIELTEILHKGKLKDFEQD